ncbi:hypothetical protein [Methylobacterium durans]|nr:hypothetical protein [Methylobacterium durans]
MTPQRIAGTFETCRPMQPSDVRCLASHGVRPEVLHQPDAPFRKGYVAWLAEKRFIFEAQLTGSHVKVGGERALLILVIGFGGQPVDIAAWDPGSGRLATWLDKAWALGQDMQFRLRCQPAEPLPIRRDALSWLKADRHGLVLIRSRLATEHLRGAGPLLAEDVAHGRALKKELASPTPTILIPMPAAWSAS